MSRCLFVYGTLMNGMDANGLLSASARFVSRASMQGRLYGLGAYPAAVASGNPEDTIAGELHELADAAAIRTIDEYEGCDPTAPGSLFTRETVSVRPAEGEPVAAWAYFFARPLPQGARRILSGDYRLSREGQPA